MERGALRADERRRRDERRAGDARAAGRDVSRSPTAGSARASARRSRRVERGSRDYRFDFAASALYEFTWNEFCDWYLELAKPVLQPRMRARRHSALPGARCSQCSRRCCARCIRSCPSSREEIWQRVAPLAGVGGATDHARRPTRRRRTSPGRGRRAEIAWIMSFVLGVRQIRGEMDISPARRIAGAAAGRQRPRISTWLERHRALLERLAGICELARARPGESRAAVGGRALVGELELLVPMAGLIDPAAELERLASACAAREQRARQGRRPSSPTATSCATRRRRSIAKDERAWANCARRSRQLARQLERLHGAALPREHAGP